MDSNTPTRDMVAAFIGSALRHFMSIAGGSLITNGVISADGWQQITGGVIALASLAMAWWQKHRQAKVVEEVKVNALMGRID